MAINTITCQVSNPKSFDKTSINEVTLFTPSVFWGATFLTFLSFVVAELSDVSGLSPFAILDSPATLFSRNLPNGLRYWLVGGTLIHSTGRKMFGALKMLEKPHRTHKSSAPLHDGGHHISQKKQGGWTKYTAKMADEEAVH